MNRVLSLGIVAQVALGHGEQTAAVGAHQLLEGVLLAGAQPGEQIGLSRSVCNRVSLHVIGHEASLTRSISAVM